MGEAFSATAAIFIDQATPEFERMLAVGNGVNGDFAFGTPRANPAPKSERVPGGKTLPKPPKTNTDFN